MTDPARIFADTPFNGDGVITELSTDEEFIRAVIRDAIECVGGVADRLEDSALVPSGWSSSSRRRR